MKYFESYFKDTDFDSANEKGEVAVLCPFPHTSSNGTVHYDTNPSAHVNIHKDKFHCKTCGMRHSEASFIKEIEGISYKEALKLLGVVGEKHEDKSVWEQYKSKLDIDFARGLNFSDEVIKDLQLGSKGQEKTLCVPVFVYGDLLDVRTYRPNQKPKWLSEQNTPTGLIIPDVATMKSVNEIIWCAGEKDMAIARTNGYDAYCCTGGEMSVPSLFKGQFKGKKTYIVYDNDDTGIAGALKMATFVYECGGTPYIVLGHHKVCVEKGEDLWDYFCKYEKTKTDFDMLLFETPVFNESDYHDALEKDYPLYTLQQLQDGHLHSGAMFRAVINVSASFNGSFSVPDVVHFKKTEVDEKGKWDYGHEETWYLEAENCQDLLMLCDNNLKEDKVNAHLKALVGLTTREQHIQMTRKSTTMIYKATLTESKDFEYSADADQRTPVEFVAYGLGCYLETGKSYTIKGKMLPHPLLASQNVIVITEAEQFTDEVETFTVTEDIKHMLDTFMGDDVDETLKRQFEWARGFMKAGAPESMFNATELYYHTPNYFYLGRDKLRGYLDIIAVGDTRTGKSSTAQVLSKVYNKGNVLSLKTATTQSLIGGTDKSSNVTKLGSIPRNHRGAIILEEFSTADPTFIKTMTEIRSSGVVRIDRVQSTIQAPCMVRMLTISNPKPTNGTTTRTLSSYANGVQVLEELIGAHEDIARYDFALLLPSIDYNSGYEYEDFMKEETDHPAFEAYQARLNWVWSRKPEQIKFTKEALQQLRESSRTLNKKMDCSIKLLGQELHIKLARISVAVAGRMVSTTNYEDLVVEPQHVVWAQQFLDNLYDNDTFKFKQYADSERAYISCNEDDVREMQSFYMSYPQVAEHLEQVTNTSRSALKDLSGMSADTFAPAIKSLVQNQFIQVSRDYVVPTVKMRKAMAQIERRDFVTIGDVDNSPF